MKSEDSETTRLGEANRLVAEALRQCRQMLERTEKMLRRTEQDNEPDKEPRAFQTPCCGVPRNPTRPGAGPRDQNGK